MEDESYEKRDLGAVFRRWMVLWIVVAFLTFFLQNWIVQEAESMIWPPGYALDMEMVDDGTIGIWGHMEAYYFIWKYKNGNDFVGFTRSIWNNMGAGLDYHSSIIRVETINGLLAPGSGSLKTEDPYGYLPRDGQWYEYNSNDNDDSRDILGWSTTSRWVELPKTSVPATWRVNSQEMTGVNSAFVTDPDCWRPGNDDMRQGVTYTSGGSSPDNYYMRFNVYYHSRAYGWWSCFGGTYVTYGYQLIQLDF